MLRRALLFPVVPKRTLEGMKPVQVCWMKNGFCMKTFNRVTGIASVDGKQDYQQPAVIFIKQDTAEQHNAFIVYTCQNLAS
jgi:hypothetical protein